MKRIKRVSVELEYGANAYALLAAWKRAAKKQGWTPSEIREVIDEAKEGLYDDLFDVLTFYSEDPQR